MLAAMKELSGWQGLARACARVAWAGLLAWKLAAAESGAPAIRYGYTDTPMLPGYAVACPRQQPAPAAGGRGWPGDAAAPAAVGCHRAFRREGPVPMAGTSRMRTLDGGVINVLKNGQIRTKQDFGDCQLHVEWATPAQPDGNVMNWGNSGVYIIDRYEVQIIQSRIYADGVAGSIYGQTPPLVTAARKAGEWQTYDIIFTAPRVAGDKLLQPAYFTVIWNGVLVQDHVAALGPTQHRKLANYDDKTTRGPVMLQSHNSGVLFRNIWIRPLSSDQAPAGPGATR
jgi:hypothetical protein